MSSKVPRALVSTKGHRSMCCLFQAALQDALAAREAEPRWPKAYYRQGVALQCLGRHGDAHAAFSSGLAQDPKSAQLLAALVEAAMKSPLRGECGI